MKKNHALIAVIAVAALAPAATIIHNPEAVQRLTFTPATTMPHPTGPFTTYNDPAAYGWQTSSVTPWHTDGVMVDNQRILFWPILAYYEDNPVPMILYYWDGRFRHANGNNWRTPHRWAYVRHTPEEWNEALQQFTPPKPPWAAPTDPPPVNPAPKPVSKSLQHIIDGLKMRHTTTEIQDAIDRSQYNEPSEGAPLPTAGEVPL